MKIRGGIDPLQFWGGLLIRNQESAAKAVAESKIHRKSLSNHSESILPENISSIFN